ncbi:MAG: thioredoxin [Lachnospiraceae bacterium]|nr:thioredoxin [Lachnospiraceae bacterium]
MAVVEITSANFDEVVGKSEVPVLVDFWASWCGPCKMLSPIVDQISETAEGFAVGKVNVDDEGELAEKFGINSIPCLILFKDGKEAKRSVGFIPKDKVLELAKS